MEDEAWDAELAQRLLTSTRLDFTSVVVAAREPLMEQLASFRPDVSCPIIISRAFREAALAIAQEQCPDIPFVFWAGVLGDEAAVALIKQRGQGLRPEDRPAWLPSVIGGAIAGAEQRARLAHLDDQPREAQRLASLGHLGAAEQAMSLTRQLLGAARQEVITAEPSS